MCAVKKKENKFASARERGLNMRAAELAIMIILASFTEVKLDYLELTNRQVAGSSLEKVERDLFVVATALA